MQTSLRLAVGERIGGYLIERVEALPNLRGTYVELRHEGTGARHIHIDAPHDGSKAFAVQFATVPRDSRGVAHILEHVVLAGSQRYPVRDPFFSMTTRSASDFMNAMTASDATTYPFSTRNRTDFYNLLDVYLDAAFFPLITENSFRQEGHRLEFEEPGDPSSGLRIKGVVYNEMKGAMASAASVAHRAIGKAVLPGSTYANNSGGDPSEIPNLTWQDLRDFHATHYHPSNARFFTYADLPLDEILSVIEDRVLSKFEATTPDVDIPDQPRFAEPGTYREAYPLAESEDPAKKNHVFVSWLAAPVSDTFETAALQILSEILLGNAGSPLRKALIDSGLGDDLAPTSGYRTSAKEAIFSAGLQGVAADSAAEVERVIFSTLEKLATEGIPSELVEAAVHQYELYTREVSNDPFPYSLRAYFMLRAAYSYGGDPYRALRMDADFDRLHAELAAGPFFENVIRKYLLDNPHRSTLTIYPDPQMESRQRADETERTASIEAALTDEERDRIVTETLALKAEQENPPDVSLLPTLDLSEIPLTLPSVELSTETVRGATVAVCDQPTNGICYVALSADISGLPDPLRDRLGLFVRALSEVGAAGYDFAQQAVRIDRFTGGLQVGTVIRTSPDGRQLYQALTLAVKCLSRNVEPMMEILRDVLSAPNFETGRMTDLLAEYRSELEMRVVPMGQMYAERLALSRLTPDGALAERLSGITHVRTVKALSGDEELCTELDAVRKTVFSSGGLNICLTAEPDDLERMRKLLDGVLDVVEGTPSGPVELPAPAADAEFEAVTTAAPVVYNAVGWPTVTYANPDAAALYVLARHLKSQFLHREIREKGGAYGSQSTAHVERGVFSMWSYRDPHMPRTYETFRRAVEYAVAGDLPDEEVREAKLRALASTDPLTSPDVKGRRRFFDDLAGYTKEIQEAFKERILAVSKADLARVADTYLTAEPVRATVGSAKVIEEGNAKMGGIFRVSPA